MQFYTKKYNFTKHNEPIYTFTLTYIEYPSTATHKWNKNREKCETKRNIKIQFELIILNI